jgi:putative sterol carrier protein
MTDPTAEFFQELQQRGNAPLMGNATGTIRFEVVNGSRVARWFVSLKKGDVTVSRQGAEPDCVVRGDKALIDGMFRGDVNPMTATLRGDIEIEGDIELLVLFQRVLPGPDTSRLSRTAEPAGSRS